MSQYLLCTGERMPAPLGSGMARWRASSLLRPPLIGCHVPDLARRPPYGPLEVMPRCGCRPLSVMCLPRRVGMLTCLSMLMQEPSVDFFSGRFPFKKNRRTREAQAQVSLLGIGDVIGGGVLRRLDGARYARRMVNVECGVLNGRVGRPSETEAWSARFLAPTLC